MNIEVTPQVLCGTVPAISSKSDAHRLLIAAALADAPTVLKCNVLSEDIRATAECMRTLGANIEYGENEITVEPIKRRSRDRATRLRRKRLHVALFTACGVRTRQKRRVFRERQTARTPCDRFAQRNGRTRRDIFAAVGIPD